MVVKIEILTSSTCSHCPRAERILKDFSKERGIKLKYFNSATKKGKRWASKFVVSGVPSYVIFGEVTKVLDTGVPSIPHLEKLSDLVDGKREIEKSIFQKIKEKFS